ncbi:hypothetical protein [Streptomyces sp. SID1121]|uniref:hypothetical protein n=1 Tax=Streptomyces sp. SID1121 TaxID=3425888 RepID=UPI004055AC82
MTFTRRRLAVWYGGCRSVISAHMAGVQAASRKALTSLVRSTAQVEPRLPDHV